MSDFWIYTILALLSLILLIWSMGIIGLFLYGITWVPTPTSVAQKMIDLSDIQPGQKVYELGCGDGRLLFLARKKTKYCTGYELLWPIYLWGRWVNIWKKDPVSLQRKDFFSQDLSEADVIFCYLSPGLMQKIYDQKWPELKPGTKLISHSFALPNISPVQEVKSDGKKILVYRR